MVNRVLKRSAAPVTVLISVLALAMAMIGTANADPADPPGSPWSGDQSSSNLGWNMAVTAINGVEVTRDSVGANVAEPGDLVTYTANIWKNNGVGRYITAIRQAAPAGFAYVSHAINKESTIADEGNDGVKATCSGGGCSSVPLLGTKGYLNDVRFSVTYKIPDNFAPGDYNSGFHYDVYSFGSGQGASATNAWIRVEDNRVDTTTTLDVPAQAGQGAETALTANVSPSGATGSVQFYVDGSAVGEAQAVNAGTATLNHRFEERGDFAVTAKFTATSGYHDSESGAAQIEVGDIDTATALVVPATAEAGTAVTMKANLTPANAAGSVQFAVDGVNVGNPVTVTGGEASLDHRFDEPGDRSVTASFTGAFGFTNSDAAAQQVSVEYGAWQTTTVVVEPVSAESGSPTNLMASVRPIPTGGEIVFRVEGNEVGRVDVGTADGVAVLEHTFATAGDYQVVAEFTGTAGFDASTSAAFTAIVQDAPPVPTAVDATLSVQGLSVAGQTVTLTADVNPADTEGAVQFYKGAQAIGGPVAVVDGKASTTTTLDFEGTQVLSAKFIGGDGFRDTVSNPVVLNVSPQPEAPEAGAGSLGSLLEGPFAALLAGSLGG